MAVRKLNSFTTPAAKTTQSLGQLLYYFITVSLSFLVCKIKGFSSEAVNYFLNSHLI